PEVINETIFWRRLSKATAQLMTMRSAPWDWLRTPSSISECGGNSELAIQTLCSEPIRIFPGVHQGGAKVQRHLQRSRHGPRVSPSPLDLADAFDHRTSRSPGSIASQRGLSVCDVDLVEP